MSINRFIRRVRPSSLIAIAFVLCAGAAPRQSSADSEVRTFNMAMFSSGPQYRPTWGRDARYVDYSWFIARSVFIQDGQDRVKDSQPGGRSILSIGEIYNDARAASTDSPDMFFGTLQNYGYDWSRIVAVVIDEPFWTRLGSLASFARPCNTGQDPEKRARMIETAKYLANAYAAVKRLSPGTRFWVNYSEPELQWIMGTGGMCNNAFANPTYFDVISLDKYRKPFFDGSDTVSFGIENSSVWPYYKWLLEHRSDLSQQQFAFVPGLFYVPASSSASLIDPSLSAQWLAQFFTYAQWVNTNPYINGFSYSCTVDALALSATREENRCPIWLVAGWGDFTSIQENGETWDFLWQEGGKPILDEWRSKMGKSPRVKKAVPTIVTSVLH